MIITVMLVVFTVNSGGGDRAMVFVVVLVVIVMVAVVMVVGFPGGSDGKESACSAGDLSSIPGSERSSGEGNGYPLQYPCLENSMGRRAWRATVHGVTKSQAQLSN